MCFIRKIDELGRIVIPKEIRNCCSVKIGDEVCIEIDDNKIILFKINSVQQKLVKGKSENFVIFKNFTSLD